MVKPDLPNFFVDLAKIVGGAVKDAIDVGDYRITIIIEKKLDDKTGIVIDNLSIEKKMNAMEVETIGKRLKELINRETYINQKIKK